MDHWRRCLYVFIVLNIFSNILLTKCNEVVDTSEAEAATNEDFKTSNEVESLINSTQENIRKLLKIFNTNGEIAVLKPNEKSSHKLKPSLQNEVKKKESPATKNALQAAAQEGLNAMMKLYEKTEPDILRKGQLLEPSHPGSHLSLFSAPVEDIENSTRAAYAILYATKKFHIRYKKEADLGRQAPHGKLSFRRTSLEAFCPPRDRPICMPAAQRYRTHDGTCNNPRRGRWGSAQMPFNRFLSPDYSDGIDAVRSSVEGGPLPSARFVSLLVHGAKEGESPVTLMLAQWGQFIDHDITSTAQPRPLNGSVPRCCGPDDQHPSCLPIKVPFDDPWLAPLKVRCLEFLRSAPAQRRDCTLTWREQINQATSYLDASVVYSSSARISDMARVFQKGLLQFGRGDPRQDVCLRAGVSSNCIRAGDSRNSEQPGLLALHHVWVGEHNRLAMELSDLNPHWSDEKVYQEARRIIGAYVQHITYREFLPLVLGREVCKLFKLELLQTGYSDLYDAHVNPTIANSFASAAFRFGHSLIQSSYLRCDRDHNFIDNNVTLHEEFAKGDIGTPGSLNRLLRGLAVQRSLERDEFITPELTNHLFQSGNFPFGLDLAAINIQRGRDHGLPGYTQWREPCGLSPINKWEDLESIMGPGSTRRISHAYRSVHDIDLFVGGMAERPVIGGLVGPTFACIIAQQFSNLRRGDRFWYENSGFESSFTPAQLQSIRKVSLAQVICRTLGAGTLQPLIFLPHNIAGNERIPCGKGSLVPIDLTPWQEEDIFQKMNEINIAQIAESLNFNIPKLNASFISKTPIKRVDFIPNSSIGIQQMPALSNTSKINDKLDFEAIHKNSTKVKKQSGVNNKLKSKINGTKHDKLNPKQQNMVVRRRIIINNIPINLARTAEETGLNSTVQNASVALRKGKEMSNLTEPESTPNNDTIPESKSAQREYDTYHVYGQVNRVSKPPPKIVISGPSEEDYEIEINIRPTANKKTRPPTYHHVPVPIPPRPIVSTHGNRQPVRDNYVPIPQPPVHNNYVPVTQKPIRDSYVPASQNPIRNTYGPSVQNPVRDSYIPQSQLPSQNTYTSPTRVPIQDNYIGSSTETYSPFSRPSVNRPYQQSGYGTRTKPPNIIYINDPEFDTTTQRPGFLQTILTIGGGGSKNTYQDPFNYDPRPEAHDNNDRYDKYGPTSTGTSTSGNKITSIFNYAGAYTSRPNIELTLSTLAKRNSVDSLYGISNTSIHSHGNVPAVSLVTRPTSFGVELPSYTSKPILQPPTTTAPPYGEKYEVINPPMVDITQRPPYQVQSNTVHHVHTTRVSHLRPHNVEVLYEESQVVNITQRPLYKTPPTMAYNRFTTDYHRVKDYEKPKPKPEVHTSLIHTAIPVYTTTKHEDEEEFDDYYDDLEDSDLKLTTEDINIKPQHLILYLLNRELPDDPEESNANETTANVGDDYVLPILRETNASESISSYLENYNIPYEDTWARKSASEVLAEDYDEITSPSVSLVSERFKEIIQNASDVEIPELLNRTESLQRPDHWVVYETKTEEAYQQTVPQIDLGSSAVNEFPRPINISQTKKLVDEFLESAEVCKVLGLQSDSNSTDVD